MVHLKQKYNSNQLVVNTKSNFKSHLVKCQTMIDNIQFDEIVLRGMGKATSRAINLALQLNSNNHNTFELKPKTYSVKIMEDKVNQHIRGSNRDNFNPDSIDLEKAKKVTHIPAVEITVRKSKTELDKTKSAKKQSKYNRNQKR